MFGMIGIFEVMLMPAAVVSVSGFSPPQPQPPQCPLSWFSTTTPPTPTTTITYSTFPVSLSRRSMATMIFSSLSRMKSSSLSSSLNTATSFTASSVAETTFFSTPETTSTAAALSSSSPSPSANPLSSSHSHSPLPLFWDEAKICVSAGAGGNGCVSFRREKGQARGGPNGGNGGRGGSVFIQASARVSTLMRFRRGGGGTLHYRAQAGTPGQGHGRNGAHGSNVIVTVPVGTLVREGGGGGGGTKRPRQPPVLTYFLPHDGDSVCVAKGGRGGRGNAAFQTSRRTAPKLCEKGERPLVHDRWLQLEMQLIAQVGFVGRPNAGKSTLLSVVSSATPAIAEYPFTTIVPNLGICHMPPAYAYPEHPAEGLVLLDIPGLIPGAARGVGMGTTFLRHIQRCAVLVHLLDASRPHPLQDYVDVQHELALYRPPPNHYQEGGGVNTGAAAAALVDKPQVIVINKVDLVPEVAEACRNMHLNNNENHNSTNNNSTSWIDELRTVAGHSRIIAISAVTQQGVSELMARLSKMVAHYEQKQQEQSLEEESQPQEPSFHQSPSSDNTIASSSTMLMLDKNGLEYAPDDFCIESDPSYPGQWRIRGPHVEAVAHMTHWEYPEAVERFSRQLRAMGVDAALLQRGAQPGDLIMIADYDFDFAPTTTTKSSNVSSSSSSSSSSISSLNPYIPQELLDAERAMMSTFTAQPRPEPQSQPVKRQSRRKKQQNQQPKEPSVAWRPFTLGGYLDMDADDLRALGEGRGPYSAQDLKNDPNDKEDNGDNSNSASIPVRMTDTKDDPFDDRAWDDLLMLDDENNNNAIGQAEDSEESGEPVEGGDYDEEWVLDEGDEVFTSS